MNSRVQAILEDYDCLLEMHEEQADIIDFEDIEAHAFWNQIETDLKQLSRRIASVKRGKGLHPDDLDEVVRRIEELNDLYGELAAISWRGNAAAG